MKKVNIAEAKARLSELLEQLGEAGEPILICKRNVPVAELRPLPKPRQRRRPIGLARGKFVVPAAFFEPLPEPLIDAFEGR